MFLMFWAHRHFNLSPKVGDIERIASNETQDLFIIVRMKADSQSCEAFLPDSGSESLIMQLDSSDGGESSKGNPRKGIGRWKKGQSGNPAGRPKNEPLLSPAIRRQLREVCPHDPQGRTWLEVMAVRLLEQAAKGNPAAIKELFERIDGKVSDHVELDLQLNAVKSMTDSELEAIIAGEVSR